MPSCRRPSSAACSCCRRGLTRSACARHSPSPRTRSRWLSRSSTTRSPRHPATEGDDMADGLKGALDAGDIIPAATTVKAGHLVIGGCDVTDLAERYGTPLYIY